MSAIQTIQRTNQPLTDEGLANEIAHCDHGQRRRLIAESLLLEIFRGRIHSGQRLIIHDLAKRFGVSPTPIRESLIVLEGIGVIDLAPNRGAIVRNVSVVDVKEASQVRRALECQATKNACGRIDSQRLHELADTFQKVKAAKNRFSTYIEEARDLDSALHDLITDSCGNRFLIRELNRIKLLFRALRDAAWEQQRARNDKHRLVEEATEHLAIINALLENDRNKAARLMSRHIRSGARYWSRAVPGL
ncbi:GntR family transcriptional regulator [Calycomorphotria hydatis]|uniref:Putative HTH-type transcriptional regulator YdfH n=1 Tax=Calycomorphotria hydatis TaxID=2528027 RepID=A0A517TEG2_9PLAN|nr:GntR family transcriptional regulator [Calycomorphotria hydatis]QDT66768.1 putative HTH-type transcriptional regulator YdfH [Calycomorphotria hydatis]